MKINHQLFKTQVRQREKYHQMFKDYPDVVDIETMCEMLGGVTDGYIRRRLQSGVIRGFYLYDIHCYMIPKTEVINFLFSEDYYKSKCLLKHHITGDYAMNAKIIAISNQKGGTGKTTTAINLGSALAHSGEKVLLVDFDPQANLTMSCGIEYPDKVSVSMNDALSLIMDSESLPDKSSYIQHHGKIDIIPSNINLSITEINLRNEMGGENTLSSLLEPLRKYYDFIIIDTNPSLSLLTINALVACDSVVIPVSPQLWSATGLTDLMKTIFKVRRKLNPRIKVEGILLTMCDERTNLFREARNLIDGYYKNKITVFDSHIPATVKVGEANYYSRSVMDFDPKNKAAIAYIDFAREVVQNA